MNLHSSYENFLDALTIVDMLNSINLENNPCDIIFRLVLQSVKKITKSQINDLIIYYVFFQIQLLIYLGYQPNWQYCHTCNIKISDGFFDNNTCHILCPVCTNQKNTKINSDVLVAFQFLTKTHIDIILENNQYNKQVYQQLNMLLYKFINFYLPQIKSCKTFHTGYLYE